MKPQEQRELMVWGGAALGVVVVGWIWLAIKADAVASDGAKATALHGDYVRYYLGDGQRLPEDAARAALDELLDAQRREVELAQMRLVWPGRSSDVVPVEFAGFDFRAGMDYNTARDKVSRVNARVRGRAESLGVPLPVQLPFERAPAIENQDGATGDKLRGLQMAQACCYAFIADLCMDAGVARIVALEIGESWRDASGDYAVVSCTGSVDCSYAGADRITRDLMHHRNGLGLEQMRLEQAKDGVHTLSFTVTFVVPGDRTWQLAERKAGGGRGAATSAAPAERQRRTR